MLIKLHDVFCSIRNRIRKYYMKTLYGKQYQPAKGVFARKSFTVVIEGNGEVSIGSNTFFNNYCSINCMKKVAIGENCVLGENVKIYDHDHIYKNADKPISEQGFSVKEVSIGDNCWLGSNVTVLKGTHIGDHCVIGANCLVFGDIPNHTIVRLKESDMEKITVG